MPSSAVGKALDSRSAAIPIVHADGTLAAPSLAWPARGAPRRAVRLRPAVDGHVPARAALDGRRPLGARVGGPADDHHVDAGPGRRAARGRSDQRRARAPAPAAHRPGRLHGHLAAVRHGPQHLVAARLPADPGRRRSRRHRHRARDRARPAHRRRRRALLRPAHARRRAGADPRPAARRRAAARHRLARHLRRACRHRGGAAARGLGDAGRDAARGAAPRRRAGGNRARLRRARARAAHSSDTRSRPG